MLIKRKITTETFYFACLILLGMSLSLSKYTTGLFQFLLVFIWLIYGIKTTSSGINTNSILEVWRSFLLNFSLKINKFWNNKTALVLSSLFLIYLTGLFRGGDFNYILADLRGKLPLLILPLILAGLPSLNKKQFHILLLSFVGAVFIGTLFSAIELFGQKFTDIREISIFISPVRFGLNICMAIIILAYIIITKNKYASAIKILMTLLILWLIFILFKLESGIGILILTVLSFVFVLKQIFVSRSIILKLIISTLLISVIFYSWYFINNEIKNFYSTPKIDFSKLEKTTKSGNQYVHDTLNYLVEDGNFTGLFLCEKELENTWNERSSINYGATDNKGQSLRATLIRFLTSKNFRKDKEGVEKLSDAEIVFIENGIANANYIYHPGVSSRISKILFGYQVYLKTSDPGGNSLTKRFEHWKASAGIIKENIWLGVGTGNIPQAFDKQYNSMPSNLAKEKRMESHNQYLHVLLNMGIIGFIWFLFALIYPAIRTKEILSFQYLSFLLIILISMITEDTLETQSGVTFFAFFNSLFLLRSSD